MPAYRSKEVSVEGMHRNQLSSVRWRKYDIVNFIIQATGQAEFFLTCLGFILSRLNTLLIATLMKIEFFLAEKKIKTGPVFFAALPSSHFPETKSTKKEKEKRKTRFYFESFCRLRFFIIKSNQFSFLDLYIFIVTVLWRRNLVLF